MHQEIPFDPHSIEAIVNDMPDGRHSRPLPTDADGEVSQSQFLSPRRQLWDVEVDGLNDDDMLDAIDALPYELRAVVEARVYGKEPWWVIGEAQGYSRFTAKARWLEALEILRAQA